MANRCPDCNKFVGIEFNEPEDIDIQITRVGELEEGGIQHLEAEGEVRLVLTCADCGAELAESEQTYECEVEFQHVNDPHCTGDVEVTIEAMNDDFFDPPGRPPRYQKHYYQANLTTTFKCPTCESEAEVEGLVNEAAGGFNEC